MPRSIDYTNKVVTQQRTQATRQMPNRANEADPEAQAVKIRYLADVIQDLIRAKPNDYIDFFNIPVAGSATVTLPHGFNGAVRWYVVDAVPSSGATPTFEASRHYPNTDTANELVLDLVYTGTLTVRVEQVQ